MKFIKFTTKLSKVPDFFTFRQHIPILDPFQKLTSIRKPLGSGLKRVATSNVSKRHQTNLIAHLSKTLLENLKYLKIIEVVRGLEWFKLSTTFKLGVQ